MVPAKSAQLIRFGMFELDVPAGELRKNGRKVKLQDQPFQMLRTLLERPGKVVSREDMQQRLWPADTFVDFDHGLNRSLNKLREALGDSAENPRFVETLARRGYRFIAPVSGMTGFAPGLGEIAEPQTGGSIRASSPRRRWLVTAAVPAVLLAGLLALLLRQSFYQKKQNAGDTFRPQSLAVLPLSNLSNDPAQEYFSDGMTEALITDVAKIDNLRVISRTSIMQYKNSKKSVPEIARELNVDAVIEGSVFLTGGRVRITAQLIRAFDDRHLWADEYDRDVRDVFSLQDDVAREITQQVARKIAEPAQSVPAHPVNPDAHEAYLRGRYFWNKRSESGYIDAISFFQKAVQIDPNYARAYAGLADAYALLGSWSNSQIPRRVAMPNAKQAALKAIQLDDQLAEAHTSLAFVEMHYEWKFKEAEKEFQRALQLNPNYSTAHQWYAYDLVAMQRASEALAEIRLAERLDPASVIIANDVGEMLFYNGQLDAAIEQGRKALQMDSTFSHAHALLAWAYEQKKMFPDSISELQLAVKNSDRKWYLGSLAYAYAIAGQSAEARKLLTELEQTSRVRYDTALDFAQAYVGLRDNAQAFRWLEQCYEERAGSLILFKAQPEFRTLRSDSRYVKLASRIGLPE
jgi:TolB-like protein/DNA-binding winged helix-turn-helix (wHTH) protein/tetratricopeptide (TPR) repeat protein